MTEYPRSRSRREAEAGREAARVAAALAFASAFAECVPDVALVSREDAERLAARAAAVFEPLIAHPALDEVTHPLALDLYGAVVAWLSRRGLDLRPLARVTTTERLPSTLLATQIYSDPARAAEICEMNDAATPFALPTVVDVVRP